MNILLTGHIPYCSIQRQWACNEGYSTIKYRCGYDKQSLSIRRYPQAHQQGREQRNAVLLTEVGLRKTGDRTSNQTMVIIRDPLYHSCTIVKICYNYTNMYPITFTVLGVQKPHSLGHWDAKLMGIEPKTSHDYGDTARNNFFNASMMIVTKHQQARYIDHEW